MFVNEGFFQLLSPVAGLKSYFLPVAYEAGESTKVREKPISTIIYQRVRCYYLEFELDLL